MGFGEHCPWVCALLLSGNSQFYINNMRAVWGDGLLAQAVPFGLKGIE